MGRYAFFNTEFEYKFWFAIQGSLDITLFGGMDTTVEEENPSHEWNQDDLEYIRAKLVICARDTGVQIPDFEKYTKDVSGTYKMVREIREEAFPSSEVAAYFSLGCCIYHQLLYTPTLTATYEW